MNTGEPGNLVTMVVVHDTAKNLGNKYWCPYRPDKNGIVHYEVPELYKKLKKKHDKLESNEKENFNSIKNNVLKYLLQFKSLGLEEKIKKFDADLWENVRDMSLPNNIYDLSVKMHEIGDSEYVSQLNVLYSTGDAFDEQQIAEFYDKNAKRIVEQVEIITPGDNWDVRRAITGAMREKNMGPWRWVISDPNDSYPDSYPVIDADYPATYEKELIAEIKKLQPETVEQWML